ncbi:RpiB/LacA/LacB family sugar-phosphate isomerase [bacterium]|nr:RpiB/LacA/LacB family sugar-phosphate isomerase [bacterium]
MKVILGADHGGFEMKELIKKWLATEGYTVEDVGAANLVAEDDYVYFAKQAVKAVTSSSDRVILFCRNGFGMVIAANRFAGVRCGLAFDTEAVRKGRVDDDINALSVPSDYFDEEMVIRMIKIFLTEKKSEDDKYKRRIMKLDNLI